MKINKIYNEDCEHFRIRPEIDEENNMIGHPYCNKWLEDFFYNSKNSISDELLEALIQLNCKDCIYENK